MKQQPSLYWLVPLIVVLALFSAGIGLFYPNVGNSFSFTTVRGEIVQIWGQGWYRYDTPIGALSFQAADLITLFLAIPVLIISFVLYRQGSLRGGLLLTGALAYFLYNYISQGFGATYNNLFLVYTLLFSASLFGLILALASFDVQTFPEHFATTLPTRGIGVFLVVSGVILSLIWIVLSIVPALLENKAPLEAYYYTTFMTGILDIGVVAPALLVAGLLILRRTPLGYLLASTMLIFTSILGPNLTAGGIMQVLANVITIGQAMAFTVPFVILALVAIGLTVRLFRSFSETTPKTSTVKYEKGSRNERYSLS
ncbi:MAG TPA: hypothetical protein VK897_08545 [Anaerolineales bacterium]|nr:hypothetical protein [Anaerolineales bacterium]